MACLNKLFCCLALSVLCCNCWAEAFAELAGDLPKEISADESPYLVVADIFVPAGKTVRVAPGTVFLFKNFTGCCIQHQVSLIGFGF